MTSQLLFLLPSFFLFAHVLFVLKQGEARQPFAKRYSEVSNNTTAALLREVLEEKEISFAGNKKELVIR
jgi:hypothetical protein